MATIDTSIYGQIGRPERLQTPFEQQNQLSAVLQGVNQNRMSEMKMQEAVDSKAKQNRLSALLAPEYATPEAKYSALSRGGFQKEADEFRNTDQTYRKGQVAIDKDAFALAGDKYNKFKSVIGSLSQRPDLTKDMVVQAGQEMVGMGLLTPELFQKGIANMPDDPAQLRLKLREGVMSQMTPEQQLTFFNPKAEKIDNGQTIGFRDMNPNSPTYGQQTGGAAVQRQMTPGEAAAAETARRGQNMTDARARERLDFDRGNAVAADGGPNQAPLVKRYGKPAQGYRWKSDGSQEFIPGGPADNKAGKEGSQRVTDAKDVLGMLDDAEKLLPSSTGSYAGQAIDQAARAFGKSTEGAQAAAELKALQGALVSKMPKMSGPQSDKDVLLYREMAGQIGDPTIPAATKKAAIKTIRRLNERYAGLPDSASGGQSIDALLEKYK